MLGLCISWVSNHTFNRDALPRKKLALMLGTPRKGKCLGHIKLMLLNVKYISNVPLMNTTDMYKQLKTCDVFMNNFSFY